MNGCGPETVGLGGQVAMGAANFLWYMMYDDSGMYVLASEVGTVLPAAHKLSLPRSRTVKEPGFR